MESSTIELMKEMASDPRKAEALVQDETCLGGLVMVLSNADTNVVKLALETLQRLADWPQHRPQLKAFLGMMEQLQALMAQTCPVVQAQARKLLSLLQLDPSHAPLKDTGNTSWEVSQERPKVQKTKRRNSFFVGGANKGKSVILQIKDLNTKADIEACRSCLIRVKGVISITFDPQRRRSILRTKPDLKPEVLARTIGKETGMTCEQVVKKENGDESLISFGAKPADLDKENELMPDYPSDPDTPTKSENTVTKLGGPTEGDSSWKFIKSVGNFLSTSFYW